MKKKRISKLRVSRETLRHLSDRELNNVAGGACTMAECAPTVSKTEPISNCTNDCCSNECTETCG